MKYTRAARFIADLRRLSVTERRLFRQVVVEQFVPAAERISAEPGAPWPKGPARQACSGRPRRVGDDVELRRPGRASDIRVDRDRRRASDPLAPRRRSRDLLRALTTREQSGRGLPQRDPRGPSSASDAVGNSSLTPNPRASRTPWVAFGPTTSSINPKRAPAMARPAVPRPHRLRARRTPRPSSAQRR